MIISLLYILKVKNYFTKSVDKIKNSCYNKYRNKEKKEVLEMKVEEFIKNSEKEHPVIFNDEILTIGEILSNKELAEKELKSVGGGRCMACGYPIAWTEITA